MMDWNDEQQKRFNDLRRRELKGKLNTAEQTELAEIIAFLEEEEARYLGPAVARMEKEQTVMMERLQKLQTDNEELAKLVHQQEQLVLEARRWLADFRQRHEQIRSTYTQLTGEILTTT